jgi:hypothetical protein
MKQPRQILAGHTKMTAGLDAPFLFKRLKFLRADLPPPTHFVFSQQIVSLIPP